VFLNNGGTGFNRLQLGGTTSSFGAIASSSNNVLIKDAADGVTASLGVGVSSVSASAVLEAASTTKGFLPPRMTGAQIAAISSPATALEAYNTDAGAQYQYNGSAYKSVGTISGSYSTTGAATTVFTVTFSGTQPNSTYKVVVTPTNALSAALYYVTNKTTTTFDVTYLAGLTGGVAFDYAIFQ
jgi:hypothetical protein